MSARTWLQAAWLRRDPLLTALLPLSWLFGGALTIRRWLYASGCWRSEHPAVPTIVVGNAVVGGAGKTPTVIAIVTALRARGWAPGVVSRGHGRRGTGVAHVERDSDARLVGDEPLLLRRRTNAPVVVAADRPAAARALLDAHPEVDVLVCDDGLQHLALGRDANVWVFDERGTGSGWLLPAGPLRDKPPEHVPPGGLVVYNADAASTPLPGYVASRGLRGVTPLAAWWAGAAPTKEALQGLAGRDIVAAAGMARPERFFGMLRAAGLSIVEMPLDDHFAFGALPWPDGTREVIVTEKDAVKLTVDRTAGMLVWVATLDFRLPEVCIDALERLIGPQRPPRHATHEN